MTLETNIKYEEAENSNEEALNSKKNVVVASKKKIVGIDRRRHKKKYQENIQRYISQGAPEILSKDIKHACSLAEKEPNMEVYQDLFGNREDSHSYKYSKCSQMHLRES